MKRHLDMLEERPRTRGDCADGPRPCPWVSCRHHLMIELTKRGKLKLRAEEPDMLRETCSLDVADRGGLERERIADLLGVSRQNLESVESRASERIRRLRLLSRELLDGWTNPSAPVEESDAREVFTQDFYEAVRRAYRRIVLGGAASKQVARRLPDDRVAARADEAKAVG